MKYLVLIGDGMSDRPLPELKGKTPLEAAQTPNLDFLAQNGLVGCCSNVPRGMPPASDVANMSILGYDPKKYYTGRGPLEAASLGVKLKKNQIAFRCNLVAVKHNKMKDFTAGHISTATARGIINLLNNKLGSRKIKFYTGLSYRHLLVLDSSLVSEKVKCTPPHDITNQGISSYFPRGKGSAVLRRLMRESESILEGNKTRATLIWPWSPGRPPRMPAFRKKYKKRGAIITAVHLLKGMGKVLGLEVINVPGATGYLDTNYAGKANHALRALKTKDIVFVHVEAPDEAGHEGSLRKKIKAIQDFDRLVVGRVLSKVQSSKLKVRILCLPDHPTPIKVMTHTSEAVPFVIYPSPAPSSQFPVSGYNEKEIRKSKLKIRNGHELMKMFLRSK